MIVESFRPADRELSTKRGRSHPASSRPPGHGHRKPWPPPQAEINSPHTTLNSLTVNDHELRDSLNSTSKASA